MINNLYYSKKGAIVMKTKRRSVVSGVIICLFFLCGSRAQSKKTSDFPIEMRREFYMGISGTDYEIS